MENYALHVPEKMIHDSGGKKMSGTFLTVAANPGSITIQSIWTPSLKSPSSCEFDFQQVWTEIMDLVAWRNIRGFNKRNLKLPVLALVPRKSWLRLCNNTG